jgi:hypothetical protein
MNAKFIYRLQGMFGGHYKEVRGIYQTNGATYTVVVWNRYLGSFRSLETALHVRDLHIYVNRYHRSRRQGKGWDKHVLVPAYPRSRYEGMLSSERVKSLESLYYKLLSERNRDIGRPKARR